MLHHGQGESRMPGQAAFVSVREGSGKLCSFCVVPYTRGAEYSRPAAAVLAEARRLAAAGVQEITLLGQNVNAYHGEAPGSAGGSSVGGSSVWGLGRLIRARAEIDGNIGRAAGRDRGCRWGLKTVGGGC